MNINLTGPDIIIEKDIIEGYHDYIELNRQQIETQYNIVEKILDEKFDLAYDFFCDVLEKEVRYVILRARRCQVLFHIFLPFILLNEKDININKNKTFISDNSMIKYKEDILKTSALIVDDILIHGRGLQSIYEVLDVNYTHNNISAFVLCRSNKANIVKKQFLERMECKSEVFDDIDWIDLSCRFVDVIYASASPYISFVGSYVKSGNVKSYKNFLDFHIIDNTRTSQKEQGEKSLVLFEKKDILPIFSEISYDCCLRVYENESINKSTYIPYVFLKNLDLKTSRLLFQWVCERINLSKTKIIQTDLLNRFDSKEEMEYQVKLFNALINQIYSLYLQKEYPNILNGADIDLGALCVSYGLEVASEISQIEYEDIQQVLSETPSFKITDIYVNEDSELKTIWDRINDNKKIIPFPLYFYLNRQLDEENADKLLDRKKGLTIGYFYNSISEQKKHELTSEQLKCWDSGIASCSVHVTEDQKMAFYNAAGEQSFRYILGKFSDRLKKMIYLYNKPLYGDTEKSNIDLIYESLDQLKKENKANKKYTSEELENFEKFLKENVHILGAWALPQVLR